MTRRLLVGALVVLAAPTALPQPQPPSPQFQATLDLVVALREKDVGKAMSFFARDSVVMSPNGELASGLSEIEAMLKRLVDMGALKLALASFGSSGEGAIGYDTGTWELTITPPNADIRKHTGKYVVILRRGEADRWRVFYAMWSMYDRGSGSPGVDAADDRH